MPAQSTFKTSEYNANSQLQKILQVESFKPYFKLKNFGLYFRIKAPGYNSNPELHIITQVQNFKSEFQFKASIAIPIQHFRLCTYTHFEMSDYNSDSKHQVTLPIRSFSLYSEFKTSYYNSNSQLQIIIPVQHCRLCIQFKTSDPNSNSKHQVLIRIQNFNLNF